MYRTVRNLHLILALLTGGFLVIYGVSAVQMAHNRWFDLKPVVSELDVPIPPDRQAARAIAAELAMSRAIRGELKNVQTTPAGVKFIIERPGVVYRVEYSNAAGRAHVRTEERPFFGVLNRVHHLAGFGNVWTPLNVWGAVVATVSIILIAIALTGIYLWFKAHKERRVGTVLLILSLGYSVPLIVLLRIAQ